MTINPIGLWAAVVFMALTAIGYAVNAVMSHRLHKDALANRLKGVTDPEPFERLARWKVMRKTMIWACIVLSTGALWMSR